MPVTLPAVYFSRASVPSELWVEGYKVSDSIRDITLRWWWNGFVDEIKATVYAVDDVQWETYPDDVYVPEGDNGQNIGLDTCPKNGGKRIFPCKKEYDDTPEEAAMRKKVRVVATVHPAAENLLVYFSWWDVDDPNESDLIDQFDLPFWPSGPDNYGTGASLSTDTAVTDGSGEARVTFAVAVQPGDNFKMAASTSQAGLAEMTQEKADGFGALPIGVKLSQMLTVWRKLHIEADSMEAVHSTGPEANWVTGVIDSSHCVYDAVTNQTTINLRQDLADCWEEGKQYHFENGKFWHEGAGPAGYPVLRTISHSGNDEIVVFGCVAPAGSVFYTLQDDDRFDLLPKTPDTSLLNSIFDDCYILCVSDAPGSTSDVPFKRNVGEWETRSSDITGAARRGSDGYESNSYWIVYVLQGYQPCYPRDNDPRQETSGLGITETAEYQASITFIETIRDWATELGSFSPTSAV